MLRGLPCKVLQTTPCFVVRAMSRKSAHAAPTQLRFACGHETVP